MAVKLWDVVIAGAGPAGLSAALVLGRARRQVLLCDTGTPRSWAAKEMHGFLTRDGTPPAELRRLAHKELSRYAGVEFRPVEVTAASRSGGTSVFQCPDCHGWEMQRLQGTRGKLREIVLRGGRRLERSALFFATPCSGQSQLAEAGANMLEASPAAQQASVSTPRPPD